MRKIAQANGVSVQAIAGTNCVLLGLDAEPAARKDLKGFAMRMKDPVSNVSRWLRGFKFF